MTSCAAAQQVFHETHNAMGTVWTLDVYATDEASAQALAQDAWETVDRIDDELSNYKPSSELERIVHSAVSGPVATDPETFAFLERSVYWSRASGGAFDITVGPLLRVWGFFEHGGKVPTAAQLEAVRKNVGWENIELNAATRTVRFRDGRAVDLDPGSIGKGFGVDRAVEQLRADGVRSALLSAGGSTIYAIGAPPGKDGWPVTVPDPQAPGAAGSVVLLRDTSLSTGACTQKFFMQNGHRYCHIFNPKTERPVEDMLQTTVIDPSATDSDALSTVAFVLTPAQSADFFAKLKTTKVLLYPQNQECVAVHWEGHPCGHGEEESRH